MGNSPALLVEYVRDGLEEEAHSGYLIHLSSDGEIIKKIGDSNDYPYFLRSCAKPLQASLLFDYDVDKIFSLTEKEIALCSASHAGESVHEQVLKGLLNKLKLDETYLKCGVHQPLSKTRQMEMYKTGELPTSIHNNCSGKHIMMLAVCLVNGWSLSDYDELSHPLQKAIVSKINGLCEVEEKYPLTKDGCGVPIVSAPLSNILKGYINLFKDEKYIKLKNAFLDNPYLIGGEDRTDTKIIQYSKNIVAKVGAGGLCAVVNIQNNEGVIVKIEDCSMPAREVVICEYLNRLGWANIPVDKNIKTLHNEIVGYVQVNL